MQVFKEETQPSSDLMKYHNEHTQYSKTSWRRQRSLFLICHWNKNLFPGCNMWANWNNPSVFPPPSLINKGPFRSGAQVCWKLLGSHSGSEGHQSQERERKGERLELLNCYLVLLWRAGELGPPGLVSRGNTSAGEKCLTQKRRCFVSQQRTSETFHCVCLSVCLLLHLSVCLW